MVSTKTLKAILLFTNTVGWLFLGFSIFCSLTVLPLAVGTALLEFWGGPISSGDMGGDWIGIPFYCVMPGLIGGTLLYVYKRLSKENSRSLVRRLSILLAIQVAATALALILSPYVAVST